MRYQKIGKVDWKYKGSTFAAPIGVDTTNQGKLKYIQNFAINDIGYIRDSSELGISFPYPDEYVDQQGYVWKKRKSSFIDNSQFSNTGLVGKRLDKVDYTFSTDSKWPVESRLDTLDPPDIGQTNGPIFYPNYFRNIRGSE